MLRRTFAGLALIVAALGASSCASPTLPLPPPAVPSIEVSSLAGHYHVVSSHGAEAGAIIVLVNRDTTLPASGRVFASQADDGGSWEVDVTAAKGDVMDITQEYGTTRSAPTTVQFP